ncbi:homeobox protein BEL1 homolog isoform X2 [Primulina huaijiensis]|uniref:homeobox protein BEL1 homolog isoform X2 n=1 Tax=Primulina huaijiensis TaxID=1492673 RepID=UPI003CC734EA
MYKFCMADSIGNQNLQAHLVNQLQGFELNPEIYNLSSSGMGLIGFPSKNLNQENSLVFWNGFSNKFGNHVGSPSSFLKGINGSDSSSESSKHGLTGITDSSMVSPEKSFVDFSSLRCVFPCEGNERPDKGLSLSLNSSNPSSSMGLQYSFGIRQEADLRFDPSSSRSVNIHRQKHCMMPDNFQFGNSKFLGPTQELLNELCNLGTNKAENSKQKIQKTSERQNVMSTQSLHALDHLELQKRTTKLLQMLQEVDRRYKYYYDQMKAVVSSFEAVAGNGAASVYSALASRAMSKYFRCLKYGIVSQMKAIEKAMGDKNSAATGTSKGETPRLRLLDQALRQQRAFQQTSMMENHPWRPQRGLPENSVSVLRAWLFQHFLHPYPNDTDKVTLARQTGLSKSQVSNWFINARVRLWKPMVEEMYLEEFKEHHDGVHGAENEEFLNKKLSRNEDQKPTHDQLVRIHSESLSSILKDPEKNGEKSKKTLETEVKNLCFGGVGDSFGAIELDFPSYPHHSAAAGGGFPPVSYGGCGGGGGVSLTLGLYQHGLQSSFFDPRYDMEDCQTVQYSILEGQNQNLPYRNVTGEHLLHDLAG